MPYLSVVMPLYNKEAFVADAVQSILSQTFADFELVIVDDASTDASLEIATGIHDPRLRIIRHDKNMGLSATRNTGIINAAAGFVAFLDADDLWRPTFLEKIAGLISKFPEADIFATSYVEARGDGQAVPIKTNLPQLPPGKSGVLDDYFEAARFQPPYWFGSVAVRKPAFETVGYFDEKITFGEDTDWNIRANLKVKTAYLNEPHAVYRISSQNQITASRLSGRVITDFGKYEQDNRKNGSLKKFLDANRYFLAMAYKLEGSDAEFSKLSSGIHPENLSSAQKIMFWLPCWMVRLLKKTKDTLLTLGIRATTFSK